MRINKTLLQSNKVFFFFILICSCKNGQFKRSQRSSPIQTQRPPGCPRLLITQQSPECSGEGPHGLQPLRRSPGLLQSESLSQCLRNVWHESPLQTDRMICSAVSAQSGLPQLCRRDPSHPAVLRPPYGLHEHHPWLGGENARLLRAPQMWPRAAVWFCLPGAFRLALGIQVMVFSHPFSVIS